MTLVKICGITNQHDAQLALDCGADFLGFVFYPKSPRYVTADQVQKIVGGLDLPFDRPKAGFVGVFVDEELETVARILKQCGLAYAQLHGTESPEMVRALMKQSHRVIKGFRVRDESYIQMLGDYRPTAFLLDAYVPGRPGGTGHAFEWSLALHAKRFGRLVLAGGLTPDNVSAAIAGVHPWAVDVSSGVEAVPGRKDPGKLDGFIRAAKKQLGRGESHGKKSQSHQ
jgi:phosphoribosylanthranilate isomerase